MRLRRFISTVCLTLSIGPLASAQDDTIASRPQIVPSIASLDEAIVALEGRLTAAAVASVEAGTLQRKIDIHKHVKTSLLAPRVPVSDLPAGISLRELMTYMEYPARTLSPRTAVTDFAPLRVASTELMTYTYQSYMILPECVQNEVDAEIQARFAQQYHELINRLLSKIEEVKAAVQNEDSATLRIKMTEIRRLQSDGHGGVPAGPNGQPATPGFRIDCSL